MLFTFAGDQSFVSTMCLSPQGAANVFREKQHKDATPVEHTATCRSHSSEILFLSEVLPALCRQIR